MDENAPAVLGGAGVLALLLGYFGFSAYRRKKAVAATSEAPMTQSSLAANSVFGEPTSSLHTDSSGTIADDLSVSETLSEPTSDTVDPLVEADTYLAFGKDAQAEEILLDALRADPARLAVHLKLLEIYAGRRSTMQFNTLAEELRQQTGGEGPEWDRTVELGLALDPNNSLYQSTPSVDEVAVPVADHEATMIFTAPPAVEPAPQIEEVAALDFDLDLDSSPSQPVDSPSAALAADEVAALDFDLDLGGDEEPAKPDTSAQAPEIEASEKPVAPKGLDIDFDLELPSSSPEPVAEVAEVAEDVADLGLDLDLELELPETAHRAEPALEMPSLSITEATEETVAPAEVPALPAADAVAADGNGLDFDFDLGEPEAVEPTLPDVPATDTPVLDMPSLEMPVPELASDTSGLDFDLGDERTEPVIGDDSPPELAEPDEIDLELPAETATEVDNPEASTKLELALAYEEMGDRDGARELLEEVLTEGSASQQAKAREKLDQLG
jgi:pilus assembly protein FimV